MIGLLQGLTLEAQQQGLTCVLLEHTARPI